MSSIREATVTKRIRRRGERGISRQTIAQGMPEYLRLYLYARVRNSLGTIAHETAGPANTRHSLLPSHRLEGKEFQQTSGASRAARE